MKSSLHFVSSGSGEPTGYRVIIRVRVCSNGFMETGTESRVSTSILRGVKFYLESTNNISSSETAFLCNSFQHTKPHLELDTSHQ